MQSPPKLTSHFNWYIVLIISRLLGLISEPLEPTKAAKPIMHVLPSNGTYVDMLSCTINSTSQVCITHAWLNDDTRLPFHTVQVHHFALQICRLAVVAVILQQIIFHHTCS